MSLTCTLQRMHANSAPPNMPQHNLYMTQTKTRAPEHQISWALTFLLGTGYLLTILSFFTYLRHRILLYLSDQRLSLIKLTYVAMLQFAVAGTNPIDAGVNCTTARRMFHALHPMASFLSVCMKGLPYCHHLAHRLRWQAVHQGAHSIGSQCRGGRPRPHYSRFHQLQSQR